MKFEYSCFSSNLIFLAHVHSCLKKYFPNTIIEYTYITCTHERMNVRTHARTQDIGTVLFAKVIMLIKRHGISQTQSLVMKQRTYPGTFCLYYRVGIYTSRNQGWLRRLDKSLHLRTDSASTPIVLSPLNTRFNCLLKLRVPDDTSPSNIYSIEPMNVRDRKRLSQLGLHIGHPTLTGHFQFFKRIHVL